MSSENETRVFYRAIANFASIKKELAAYRRSLAATKAAEQSFNAAGAKDRAAATKAATARSKALTAESNALKSAATRAKAYAVATGAVTVAVRASTKAIQAQNRALATNALRYTAASKAARQYATSQRKIADSAGLNTATTKNLIKERDALRESVKAHEDEVRVLKKEAQATRSATKAKVEFVEGVGEVNQATGEVVETQKRSTRSFSTWGSSLRKASSAFKGFSAAAKESESAQNALEAARSNHEEASDRVRIAELRLADAIKKTGADSARSIAARLSLTRANKNLAKSSENVARAEKALSSEGHRALSSMRQVEMGSRRLHKGLKRVGDWRPRLVPPFVALIPLIGAVIAALNPLVALIGSLSPLVVGLAGNIGSLAGAFLALPGILSGVVAGIASVIASMGGVGSVFKAYSAMQKATSGSGKTQEERAEALADAEYDLARAQKNVKKAQEGLNKAREKALQDLIDLRIEVSRAGLNEERAIANLRQATEAYWNVMADPGSTLGDKLDAVASIKEAEADLQDVRAKNIQNQKDLTSAEAKGIENSDKVLDAQENLTEAYRSQTKAQRALKNEQSGGSGSVKAINEYNAALEKLSPSARTVVLALIAMKDQWDSFRKDMQEEFFSQFVGDVERLPRILQTLTTFLRPAASAMGEFVHNFLAMVDSPEWKRDLSTIGEQNGSVVRNLGDGFLALSTAMKDVTIAAGPFTEWMTNGFARGSEKFSRFIANARETGSLANWLELVEVRLRKWWDIIKNISATLFNYSAAASPFGDWLSDGLLETTKRWKKASEDARKAGSPFKTYLEDVKPLLQGVKSLFSTFFSWFHREMTDLENIKSAQNLVKLFRDELGPALARLMDSLSATNIDEKLVKAITSIVDSLATLIENGGGAAFSAFFDVVTGAFSALANAIKSIPKPIVDALLSLFGTIAAVSFVGKFTGLTALLGQLPTGILAAQALHGWFSKIDKLKFVGLVGKAGLVGILATLAMSLPSVMSGLTDWLGSFQGIDTSTFEKAAETMKGLDWGFTAGGAKNLGAVISGRTAEATYLSEFKLDKFRQWRNPINDMANASRVGGNAWMKVDDQLNSLLDTGNIAGFQEAWKSLVRVVGDDAYDVWSLTYSKAEEAGASVTKFSVKTEILRDKAQAAESRISSLKEEIAGVGSTSKTESQAVDDLAQSIEELAKYQGITKENFRGQSDAARDFRTMLRGVDTDARVAAQAILDNGGTVDEARAKYEEGRTAISNYLTALGVPPEEARSWADAQLGPMDEVLKKFEDIKKEMSKKETINKELSISWVTRLLGPQGEPLPTTMVNGKQVVDFAAAGRIGSEPSNKFPSTIPDPNKLPTFGGGGGGGMSVALTFGLKDAVSKETAESKSIWDSFWGGLAKPLVGPIAAVVASMSGMQKNVKNQSLDPLSKDAKDTVSSIQSDAFNPFKTAIAGVQTAFTTVSIGIGLVWSTLKAKFAEPINFVINTVYNNGIRSFWNTVSDSLNLKMPLPYIQPLKYADGGVLPGYTPGRDVHQFSSPTGGRLELSGGEAIMRPEWTKLVGGPKAVAQMNKDARSGKVEHNHFSTGGVYKTAFASGGVYSSRKDDSESNPVLSWIGKFFSNPLKYVTDGLNGLINPLLSLIPGGQFGQMLAAMPPKIISSLAGIAERSQPAGGSVSAGEFVGGKTLARVLSVLPSNLRITSTYRTPEEDLAVGGTGHTRHTRKSDPAVDVAGSVPAMNAFARTLADMGGWYQVLYNNIDYPGVTPWPGHSNHVHAAMKNGGVLPKLYDNGGWLQHGQTGINLTGKPEAVLDPTESRALKALLSGSGLPGLAPLGVMPGMNIPAGSQRVVDNSVNIESFTVQNPVPEKPSESLPKAIRRVGYINSARSDS